MGKCCGPKVFTKKIKYGNNEIPVRGLEPVMFLVFNLNLSDNAAILERLREEIIKLGNSIPSEKEFNLSLLKEYMRFALEREKRK